MGVETAFMRQYQSKIEIVILFECIKGGDSNAQIKLSFETKWFVCQLKLDCV